METDEKLKPKKMIREAVATALPDAGPEERKKFEELMKEVIISGKTPAQAMGFNEIQLEAFYGIGFNLYNSGKFKEARNIFSALCHLDGKQSRHWYGLAACYHKLKEFEKAKDFYMAWSYLEPDNPLPFFHASDCSTQLNQLRQSIIYLALVINRCADVPEYQKLKEKAKATQESLKEKVGWDKKE